MSATKTAVRPQGKNEDPPDGDRRCDGATGPAFLRPEDNAPDERDEPVPEWRRPPIDWREEHDLVAGRPIPARPRPSRRPRPRQPLRAAPEAARNAGSGDAVRAGNDARRPRLDPAPAPVHATRGRRTERPRPQLEPARRHAERHRRAGRDTPRPTTGRPCSRWCRSPANNPLLEPPLLGRTIALAHLVFGNRWPPGPPIVRLPDEYRKPKKTAPEPQAPAARGTR